jgi:hypothetical protein
MLHVIFLLSATDRLHNLNLVASLYGDDRMQTAWHNFHIHSHGSAFPIGNAERFKQVTHRTACRDRLFLTVNVNVYHKTTLDIKKAATRSVRQPSSRKGALPPPSRLRLYQYE